MSPPSKPEPPATNMAGSAAYTMTSPTGPPIWRWSSNHILSGYWTSAAAPGTSYARLASRRPDVEELAGVDPAPSMTEVATASTDDDRISFSVRVAERLPTPTTPSTSL
jgi:hypothetical protein